MPGRRDIAELRLGRVYFDAKSNNPIRSESLLRSITNITIYKGLSRPVTSPRRPIDPLVLLTRTVNGTGHTGPSEFCATSI